MISNPEGISFIEYAQLTQIYSSPTRHYHNLNHIQHLLSELEQFQKNLKISEKLSSNQLMLLKRAIWFHDAYYHPVYQNGQNELVSGQMAKNEQWDALTNQVVAQLIELTAKHVKEIDFSTEPLLKEVIELGPILLDLDLSELGGKFGSFLHQNELIRQEYHFVDQQTFEQGRKAFLNKLKQRQHLFYTSYFRTQYEQNSRNNIQKYLNEEQIS